MNGAGDVRGVRAARIVAGQTRVRLELTRPLVFTRPLGRTEEAQTIRFHADDPRALVGALRPPSLT
ncbi:hypothetical protein [Streptomyces katsurahamanus]|uniref:Uncharacterized protein n=1 Tax=Streptomyces katsurahamanus TaxID=2577098 RepID=A0ABW9NT32_9ACTN|nr:hypothetical protein [Streptomyces katsurahamanus]MQS36472.1 hypothetical protein [Streptomyces katsurahamanus]